MATRLDDKLFVSPNVDLQLALDVPPSDPNQLRDLARDPGHQGVLARMRAPFTALTFVREPLSRLVSLFNMYPAGTFGKPPPGANTSARAFAAAYRRRLRGRTALTCFVSGATWCDSIGGPAPGALGASALRER